MSGPFRFVFTVIWFAIGLATVGTLKDCTMIMAGKAANAQQQEMISLGWWNRQLLTGGQVGPRPAKINR